MGFFSWKTSDTKKIIWNTHSRKGATPSPVYMITEDGRSWREDDYAGYGDFGGKDIYELIAEMNGGKTREDAFSIVFKRGIEKDGKKYYQGMHKGADFFNYADDKLVDNLSANELVEKHGWKHFGGGMDFTEAAKEGFKLPKLVEHLPSKKDWKEVWNKLPYPKNAPNQGYFADGGGVDGDEYPEFIESSEAAQGRRLFAINKDRKYFNKNEEHEVRYAQKTGRFTQSYQPEGIAKDGKWFKEAVEEKAPFDLGGWSKSRPATVRRREAIRSRDQKLSKHKQYISAGRALQALANVTKDPDTKDVAKRDADYFFEEAKRFANGGGVGNKVEGKTYDEWKNYIRANRKNFPIKKLGEDSLTEDLDLNNDTTIELTLDLGDKLNFLDKDGEWKSDAHRELAYSLVDSAPMYEVEGQYSNGGGVEGGVMDLSNTEKARMYVWIDKNLMDESLGSLGELHKRFATKFGKTPEQTEDIFNGWKISRGAGRHFKRPDLSKLSDGGGVGHSEAGYTIKGRKGKYWIDDVQKRLPEKYYDTLEEVEISFNSLVKRRKSVSQSPVSQKDFIEAERFYANGGRLFSSQKAYEKELDDYFMLDGDFSKEQDENKQGKWNYYGKLEPADSESTYLGYFNTNTNKGFMLEPTLGAANGRSLAAINKDRKYFNKNEEHEVRYAQQKGRTTLSYNRPGDIPFFASDGSKLTTNDDFSITKSIDVMDNQLGREIKYDFSVAYNKELNSVIVKEVDHRNPKDPYTRTLWMPFEGVSALYSMLDKLMSQHVYGSKGAAANGTAVASVWNVSYFDKEGKLIDQTQIDEKNEESAWELFAKFGYTREPGMYIKWEEETDPDEIAQARMFRRGGKTDKAEHIIDFVKALEESKIVAPDAHKNDKFIASVTSIVSMSKKEFSDYIKENPSEKVRMIYSEYHDWIQTAKAADGAEIEAMVSDWKAVKKVLSGDAGSGSPRDMKVLDIESDSVHKPVFIDYEEGRVVMESEEYGRTSNSLGKVKFFFETSAPPPVKTPKKDVPALSPAEAMKKKTTVTPTVTPTVTTPAATTTTTPPFQKVEKKEPSGKAQMLKQVWQEAKGSGVVLISDQYMEKIEEAILEELSDLVYETMLKEAYDYLVDNKITLKSKIFMNRIKDVLS